jgi:hypothetical protein
MGFRRSSVRIRAPRLNAISPLRLACQPTSQEISISDWYPFWIMDTGFPTEVEITDDGRLDGVHIADQVSFYARWEWHFDPAPPE